jgi:DivIVA domain-containing protein
MGAKSARGRRHLIAGVALAIPALVTLLIGMIVVAEFGELSVDAVVVERSCGYSSAADHTTCVVDLSYVTPSGARGTVTFHGIDADKIHSQQGKETLKIYFDPGSDVAISPQDRVPVWADVLIVTPFWLIGGFIAWRNLRSGSSTSDRAARSGPPSVIAPPSLVQREAAAGARAAADVAHDIEAVVFSKPVFGKRGYDPQEVDALLARLRAAFMGTEPPVASHDVHNTVFKKPPFGQRGYDEEHVDAFLDLIEAECELHWPSTGSPPPPDPRPASISMTGLGAGYQGDGAGWVTFAKALDDPTARTELERARRNVLRWARLGVWGCGVTLIAILTWLVLGGYWSDRVAVLWIIWVAAGVATVAVAFAGGFRLADARRRSILGSHPWRPVTYRIGSIRGSEGGFSYYILLHEGDARGLVVRPYAVYHGLAHVSRTGIAEVCGPLPGKAVIRMPGETKLLRCGSLRRRERSIRRKTGFPA